MDAEGTDQNNQCKEEWACPGSLGALTTGNKSATDLVDYMDQNLICVISVNLWLNYFRLLIRAFRVHPRLILF